MSIADKHIKIYKTAFDNMLAVYHQASKSHIFYVPWMVPYGARGIGSFPDEASKMCMANVCDMLNNASERDMDLWIKCFEEWLQA